MPRATCSARIRALVKTFPLVFVMGCARLCSTVHSKKGAEGVGGHSARLGQFLRHIVSASYRKLNYDLHKINGEIA